MYIMDKIFLNYSLIVYMVETEPFSQLKEDWKTTKMGLKDRTLPFSQLSRPFNKHSVD